MTAPLPISPATAVEATKASSPVAAVVSAMRRIDPAGDPVAADQVRAWADTLLKALYTAQPVRWEYRNKDDHRPGCWMQADAGHVYGAQQRGLVVRALFETPRVIQPEMGHDFQRNECTRCGMSQDWAGPDCFPPDKKVDPRTLRIAQCHHGVGTAAHADPRTAQSPVEQVRRTVGVQRNRQAIARTDRVSATDPYDDRGASPALS